MHLTPTVLHVVPVHTQTAASCGLTDFFFQVKKEKERGGDKQM